MSERKKEKRYNYEYQGKPTVDPEQIKDRVCLRCEKRFKHEVNRLCPVCNAYVTSNSTWMDDY